MKKKKWFPLVACVILLALLLIVYFILQNQNQKTEEAESADSAIQVLSVAKDDITSICFWLDGQEETFTLIDDTWILESDDSFDVDADTLSSLITSITDMTAERKLEEVTDLSEYGLDEPVQTVVLTDSEENTYTIYWGASNSMTNNDYIYINDQKDTVFTVSYSVLETFGTTLEDYRKEEEETSEENSAEATSETLEEDAEETAEEISEKVLEESSEDTE